MLVRGKMLSKGGGVVCVCVCARSSLGPFHGFLWVFLAVSSFLDECVSMNCPGIKEMPLDLLSVVIGTFNSCPLGGAELRGAHLGGDPPFHGS